MSSALETPTVRPPSLEDLPGVGPRRAETLKTHRIESPADLLFVWPLRFQDRSRERTVAALEQGTPPVVLRGKLRRLRNKVSPVRRLEITEGILEDHTGSIQLVWFGRVGIHQRFKQGDMVAIFGQPRVVDGRWRIDSPDVRQWRFEDDGPEPQVVPIYPQLAPLVPAQVRRLVATAFEKSFPLGDPVPAHVLRRLRLIDRSRAIREAHFPATVDPGPFAQESAVRRRLAFDEFLAFQLSLQSRRLDRLGQPKPRTIEATDAMRDKLRTMLPFRLTPGQKQALREIADDLRSPCPMHRLLQGDVGSGKTIVGVLAAALVNLNGYQSVVMAPTEVLADQHWLRIRSIASRTGLRIEKLTGSTPAADRRRILAELAGGTIDLLVGTHAVLQRDVKFRALGLAIIDEQHRFGVMQRQQLVEKGELVDVLAMTATPIPRSLALTLYGDVEISTIADLPPGRRPTRTLVRGNSQREKVFDWLASKLDDGGRAFIIFPLIDESDHLSANALNSEVESLTRRLAPRPTGVLHGRMASCEKTAAMERFAAGETTVLIATSLVEVGLDVPEADVIVILSADRFGLAQLHQLRGRVGRGARPGTCVLIRDERVNEEAKRRLTEFARTQSGFEVAERDLVERGAGELLGIRQSGSVRFRFADLVGDLDLMTAARGAAAEMAAGCKDVRATRRMIAPWIDWEMTDTPLD